MGGYDAVKTIAETEGLSLYSISKAMGRNPNYITSAANRGTSPSCSTLSEVLSHCGWSLVAIPDDSIPDEAIVID